MPEHPEPAVDREFLRQEYFRLQEALEKFDEKALTIKAWSVTLSMAGIGTAFLKNAPILLVLSGIASFLFWLIEAWWKVFQQAFYPRIYEIEALMMGRAVEHATSPFIAGSWVIAWNAARDRGLVWRVMFWPHVFLPHALVALIGVAGWVADLEFHFIGH
ncbi:MAG TPA: hypothetical protein VE263_09180 [Candidatus Angelobacter sp.]|nr:hypothetical protein [Candidatus Angelobacter sp.]